MTQPGTDAVLHAALDALCRRGCRYVQEVIGRMERGEVPPELSLFPPESQALALAELKAIMAVYDAPCDLAGSPGRPAPH